MYHHGQVFSLRWESHRLFTWVGLNQNLPLLHFLGTWNYRRWPPCPAKKVFMNLCKGNQIHFCIVLKKTLKCYFTSVDYRNTVVPNLSRKITRKVYLAIVILFFSFISLFIAVKINLFFCLLSVLVLGFLCAR